MLLFAPATRGLKCAGKARRLRRKTESCEQDQKKNSASHVQPRELLRGEMQLLGVLLEARHVLRSLDAVERSHTGCELVEPVLG